MPPHPWSECSVSPPTALSRATGHCATVLILGTRSHYAGDIGVSEPGPRHETSGHHRLVPGSAHYPPGRRPATVSQQIFFSDISQIFFVFSLASRAERVPASSSHQIFNIQFVILNITLCFPSTYNTKMSLLSPSSSVKLQRDS